MPAACSAHAIHVTSTTPPGSRRRAAAARARATRVGVGYTTTTRDDRAASATLPEPVAASRSSGSSGCTEVVAPRAAPPVVREGEDGQADGARPERPRGSSWPCTAGARGTSCRTRPSRPTHALSPKSASSSSRRAKHATCTTKAALKISTESCAITVATGSQPVLVDGVVVEQDDARGAHAQRAAEDERARHQVVRHAVAARLDVLVRRREARDLARVVERARARCARPRSPGSPPRARSRSRACPWRRARGRPAWAPTTPKMSSTAQPHSSE